MSGRGIDGVIAASDLGFGSWLKGFEILFGALHKVLYRSCCQSSDLQRARLGQFAGLRFSLRRARPLSLL